MGRALLQALVGIMLLTQAKASSIIALTESRVSQSVSGECLVLSGDTHAETRTGVRDGGQPTQHLLPNSTSAPLRCQGQLVTSLYSCSQPGSTETTEEQPDNKKSSELPISKIINSKSLNKSINVLKHNKKTIIHQLTLHLLKMRVFFINKNYVSVF